MFMIIPKRMYGVKSHTRYDDVHQRIPRCANHHEVVERKTKVLAAGAIDVTTPDSSPLLPKRIDLVTKMLISTADRLSCHDVYALTCELLRHEEY